jgi:hypothetical protein
LKTANITLKGDSKFIPCDPPHMEKIEEEENLEAI